MFDECIFCKIVREEIAAEKIYEDEFSLAFLDINPVITGQALVIPKKHAPSYFVKVDDAVLSQILIVAKKVAKKIDKALNSRCCLVMEGFEIDHLHYKIYPTTPVDHFRLGPQKPARLQELKKLAEKIRNY